MDEWKKVYGSFKAGFMVGVYIWLVFVVVNSLFGLIGLAVAISLPAEIAWIVNPFLMGPTLGIIKVVWDFLKG